MRRPGSPKATHVGRGGRATTRNPAGREVPSAGSDGGAGSGGEGGGGGHGAGARRSERLSMMSLALLVLQLELAHAVQLALTHLCDDDSGAVALVLLAAVLAPAARAQSQAWDEAYWGEVFGDRRCPGGEGWNGFLETCVACPEGMQSRQNSTQPCSFCPHTLMPAEPARDGCVCQEHYLNQWPSSAAADFARDA